MKDSLTLEVETLLAKAKSEDRAPIAAYGFGFKQEYVQACRLISQATGQSMSSIANKALKDYLTRNFS